MQLNEVLWLSRCDRERRFGGLFRGRCKRCLESLMEIVETRVV